VYNDGLCDGWEEERSGDGRTFTRGDDCSEERMEAAEGNRGGVTTGVVVSPETIGKTPVFGVTSV
jgi:hypothetical protein